MATLLGLSHIGTGLQRTRATELTASPVASAAGAGRGRGTSSTGRSAELARVTGPLAPQGFLLGPH